MHVLVVDDSAVVRQTVTALLAHEEGVTASVASDPLIAIQKIRQQRPDVILLDLEMPRMDGLTFLGRIMASDPIPVVICSALAAPQGEMALRALEQGAVDVVGKPRVGVRAFLEESRLRLVDTLRAASQARLVRPAPPRPVAPCPVFRSFSSHTRVIAIGASTGGTEAIRAILSELPATCPGVVIVQHMPEVFTAHFADRLNRDSPLRVTEAREGDRVRPGSALLAPGNRHMRVRRDNEGYFVALDDGPLVSRHRPSVDVLFHSVADAAAQESIGVLLTGMGSDGADGMVEMRIRGAMTFAQDEQSSVVFGMPREAIIRGGAAEVVALEQISAAIVAHATARAAV